MPSTPGLHIAYRSYGGDNAKGRPAFYSKLLGLVSLVRAADIVEQVHGQAPEILFLNDGPIPQDRVDLMSHYGDVMPVAGGSNRRSYRAAVALCAQREWPDDDLVWFAEDDYLYAPRSLEQLVSAAQALPHIDYFAMWGSVAVDGDEPVNRRELRNMDLPTDPDVAPLVDDLRWYRGGSTTSSFAVRARALRGDARLLRQLPYSGGAWDHTTCMTVQGMQPYPWADVRAALLPFGTFPPREWVRAFVRGFAFIAVNLRARRRPQNRRAYYISDPETIFHMELPTAADADQWAAVAEETRQWAIQQNIPVDEARARLTN